MGIQLQTLEHHELEFLRYLVARIQPDHGHHCSVFIEFGYQQQHAFLSLDGASRFSGDGTGSPLYLR